ncbi:MAG: ATP-binding cassette domain-containing protein, partial [Candidatus Delongbacteria bacterium]|nr:ATP-binding cassette domain-containing protein [Candidatus Delongbacteria bacterium]
HYSAGRFSFNSREGRCESCQGEGRKKIEMNFMPDVWITCAECHGKRYNHDTLKITYQGMTIAEVLELDVDQAMKLFHDQPQIARTLSVLQEVGLGYLKLGQSALTLSGGEAQRIKLARELSRPDTGRSLYVLDEPTSGLHPADIECLVNLLNRITQAGNTVIVIEHQSDLIRRADWVIEMGPEGGDHGGQILNQGIAAMLLKNT